MNRNNIWVHISIAVILVAIAAVIGQVDRWRSVLRSPAIQHGPASVQKAPRTISRGDPEVLVRFKAGTNLEMIRALATSKHDKVVDDIESVKGLVAIDDLDDADVQSVVNQYASLGNVEYAEANNIIQLDDPSAGDRTVDVDSNTYEVGSPNDHQFSEQWALHNK